jgi:acetylornithine/N-succinyldiaminopimelate aminotransferase
LRLAAAHFRTRTACSTFGGGPLACAAALASIQAIKEEKLLERSKEMGTYFMKKLSGMKRDDIVEVRGKGLMIGVEIKYPAESFVRIFAREHGVPCKQHLMHQFTPPCPAACDY